MDRSFPLQHAIYIAAKFLPIVYHRNLIPRVEWMKERAIEQRLVSGRRVDKGIKAPLIANHANFKKEAGVRVGSSFRILLGQMKPSLLRRSATLGTKNSLEGERLRAGKRMLGYEERVVNAVKLDGFPQGSLYDVGMAENRCGKATDFIDAIEGPYFGAVSSAWSGRACRQT